MPRLVLPFLFLLLTICWAVPLQDTADPAKDSSENFYRLPDTTKPLIYEILLAPDLDKFVFTGSSNITFQALKETKDIYIHAKDLNIKTPKISITPQNEGTPVPAEISPLPKWDLLKIVCNKPLVKGKQYTFILNFTGELNDKNVGFYRSRYFDGKNNVRYIATTHFEPTRARMAFPCWDEPALKANFSISILHSKSHTAVSNMPQDGKSEEHGDKKLTVFKTSPKMSSYLVAFVVSDYVKVGNDTLGVWTKPNAKDEASYALNMGDKVLQKLNEFTGLNYENYMPKMDQISIKDFNAGAMENWGLVTYREKSLLYKENVTTTSTKQSILTVIAHEFAHQWFGDLVSPHWWKYIWLNEGFATYFQYYISDQIEPTWRLMEYFVTNALQSTAFVTDASNNTRPINQDVNSSKEINSLFDDIAYQKAGSVIRMMSHILSEKVFQKGLHTYLLSKEYSSATSKDLIATLETIANTTWNGANFSTIMNNWLNEPGYPVVNVKNNGSKIELTQEHFTLSQKQQNTTWWIPITYVLENQTDYSETSPVAWLNSTDPLVIDSIPEKLAVILNVQQTGYYRVNYDKTGWELLINALTKNHTRVHPVNRAQLIDDALTMARAGRLNYKIALDFTMYLANELDYIPWTAALRNLNFLQSMLQTSQHYDTFKLYVRHLLKQVTRNVTYSAPNKDSHTMKMLRPSILKWNCKVGTEGCVEHTKTEFRAWLQDSTHQLDPDLKNAIICAGLRSADDIMFNKTLHNIDSSTLDESEKKSLFLLMGCSPEPLLKKFLVSSLQNGSKVDFVVAVQAVLSDNPWGVDIALDVLNSEYEKINKLDDADSKIKSCAESVANVITTEDQLGKLIALLSRGEEKHDLLTSVIQKGGRNVNWINSNKDDIHDWLAVHKNNFHSASSVTIASILVLAVSLFITRLY